MKRTRLFTISGLLLAGLWQPVSAKEDSWVEGEVLVTFRAGVQEEGARTALRRHSLQWANRFDAISRQRRRDSGLVRASGQTTAQLIAKLKADSEVETVEPNYIRHISAVAPTADPDFSKLWGLQNTGQTVNSTTGASGADTNFVPAWKIANPSAGEVVVGVADTGVDITHPDLAANIWVNPKEIAGNGIDDDRNGYIDDVNGYDFAGRTATMTDSGLHGTHVSGTIAAVGNNGTGVVGLAYRTKILPLKISTDGESMSSSAEISALNYAVALKQSGVNIVAINASYGGASSGTSERTAIEAPRDAGIVFCAAAGNDSANNDSTASYPANYTTSNVISVAAHTQKNGLASFSNYGATTVDLAAPGENIYSTVPVSEAPTTSTLKIGTTTYAAQDIQYGGTTDSAGLTKTIYNCGLGNVSEFPAGVSGNLALIQRGTLNFSVKVTNAMNAGAVGVIIYDNTTNSLSADSWTLGASGSWIPAVRVTKTNGEAILAKLTATGTLVNYSDTTQVYEFLDGTSMATPHVTAAVAFAAMNFPSETMAQRIARILDHTTAVPALAGKTVTGGRLDLLKMVDTDSDGLPDWWETSSLGTLAESSTADDDGDGFTNADEYLAGTSPVDAADHLAFSSFGTYSDSSGSGFALSFPTVAGRIHQVQWSSTLEAGSWAALGSALTGTGEVMQVTDAGVATSATHRFYRLQLSE